MANFVHSKDVKVFNALSSESRAWITRCLDPYHDFGLEVEGLPDLRSASSVVLTHNQSYTLSVPTSAGAGLWDARVLYTGFDTSDVAPPQVSSVTQDRIMNYDHASLDLTHPFGALEVRAGAAGVGFATASIAANDTCYAMHSVLHANAASRESPCRTIAIGVEIHNSTAVINKQGSVTVGLLPDCQCDPYNIMYVDTNGAPHATAWYQSDHTANFPATVGALAEVPTSAMWNAEEGVYFVPRLVEVQQSVLHPADSTRVISMSGTDNTYAMSEPYGNITSGSVTIPSVRGAKPSGFTPIAAYFTGLSNETTLRITFRTVVEYFPKLGDPLLPLACPSAPYDPAALKAYSMIIEHAPYAVHVSENGFGDFFRKIASVAKTVIPEVIHLLPNPIRGIAEPIWDLTVGSAENAKRLRKAVQDRDLAEIAKITKDQYNKGSNAARRLGNRPHLLKAPLSRDAGNMNNPNRRAII